jgi:hypothetical protein
MTIINGIEIDNTKYIENEIKTAIINNEPIEDKLNVVIVLSNPCNFATRYILAREFIRRMKDEKDVELYFVELAYGSQDFHITESTNKNHLQLRSKDAPFWLKENLINIGIRKLLPHNWKAVAWLDADIEFESTTWAIDTLKVLNGSKDVVQLFSHCVFMDSIGNTDTLLTGFGYQHSKKTKRSTTIKDVLHFWHPGFAWACTRKFYEKMDGLYEYAITGDGDMLMASCFISNYSAALSKEASDGYKNSLKEFESRVRCCRLGYVPGVIRHHYHGSINSRKYDLREKLLVKHSYDPKQHHVHNNEGLLMTSKTFPVGLMDDIITHFKSKNEDSSKIGTLLKCDILNILKSPTHCFLINLEKDFLRCESAFEELSKLSIQKSAVVKHDATYWKNEYEFKIEFYQTLEFLKKFHRGINLENASMNDFSEPNDPNIRIQDAPLACYISHVRAMIRGHENGKRFTIICEDDISIQNIENIEKYLPLIPDDWDIICFGSQDKNDYSGETTKPFYKFHDTFYHLHFYIIRNQSFELIFKNLYPIYDQIDIMIGNLHDKLNIYNIPNTIIQKGLTTNIQNNLHIIYNTPVYEPLVDEMKGLESCVFQLVNTYLPKNEENNRSITNKILVDVVFNNIFDGKFLVEGGGNSLCFFVL